MKRSLKLSATVALLCAGALATASAVMADELAFASRLHQTRSADGIAVDASPVSGDITPAASESDALLAGGPAVSVSYVGYRYAPPPPPSRVRYRPRGGSSYDYPPPPPPQQRKPREPQGWMELHGGILDPDGEGQESSGLGGIKFGGAPDPRVQLGVMVDWAHRGNAVTEVITNDTGPNGEQIRTQRELAESSTDLVPMLAYLQVGGAGRLPIVPYIGAGGGYQMLFLSAKDFATGETFDATYHGWAWQVWGGAAIPLGKTLKLTGEVFRTGGTVGRDLDQLGTGAGLREEIDVDGTGARFGLSFGF
jgi:hypothetical protein